MGAYTLEVSKLNRKLIRPSFMDSKNKERDVHFDGANRDGFQPLPQHERNNLQHQNPKNSLHSDANHSGSDGANTSSNIANKGKKFPPPMETNAEVFYYKKQIDSHTLMVIVLQDGEEIEGTIEWYDRSALKVNRKSAPNIMLLKHNIKYMFKAEDRIAD